MKRILVLASALGALACDPLMPLRVNTEVQPVDHLEIGIVSYSEIMYDYLRSGASAEVRADLYDAGGNVIDDVSGKKVTWTAGDPGVVEIATTETPTIVRLTGRKAATTTLTAEVEGKSASLAIAVSPGNPAQIAAVSGGSQLGIVGDALPQPLEAEVRDAHGNAVGANVSVTFLAPNGTPATVTRQTDARGRAASTWTPADTGTFNVTARISSSISTTFPVTVTRLALGLATAVPTSITNSEVVTPAPVVQLRYASNATAYRKAGVTVSVSLQSPTSSVTLSGTTTQTDANGAATFNSLKLTGTAGPVTLRFATTSPAANTTGQTTLKGGVATRLAVDVQPPASAVDGRVLSQAPVVQLQDANGNPSAQAGVVVVASAPGFQLTGAAATTDADGRAPFSQLAVSGTPGAMFQLAFNSSSHPNLTATTAQQRQLTGVESKLAVTSIGGSLPCDSTASTPIVVRLQDSGGRYVAAAGVKVVASLPSTTTAATVHAGGTAVTDADGTATFGDLVLRGTAGTYTLQFTSGTLTQATTSKSLVGGSPSKLLLTTQPPLSAQNGVFMSPSPVVRVADVCGNQLTTSGVSVTATARPAGVAFENGTRTTTSGAATFTALQMNGLARKYLLEFTSPGLTSVLATDSTSLTKGAAWRLAITTQPSSSARSGVPFAQQPVVAVQDKGGNHVAGARTITTAISPATPANGTVVGNGSTTIVSTDSIARFDSLKLTGVAGSYRLLFQSGGLVADTAIATVLGGAGTAARLVIDTTAATAALLTDTLARTPVIRLQDQSGATVALAGVTVTASLSGATLAGHVVTTDATGRAAFPGLEVLTGSFHALRTFAFSAAGLDTVRSPTTTVIAVERTKGQSTSYSGTDTTVYYGIIVPAGRNQLQVSVSQSNGIGSLQVRRGDAPTGGEANAGDTCAIATLSAGAVCTINNPPAGQYFIRIRGTGLFMGSFTPTYTP